MPTLNDFLEQLKDQLEIDDDFDKASNHPYSCTCDKCREWWLRMGPDENNTFGPFDDELWDEYE